MDDRESSRGDGISTDGCPEWLLDTDQFRMANQQAIGVERDRLRVAFEGVIPPDFMFSRLRGGGDEESDPFSLATPEDEENIIVWKGRGVKRQNRQCSRSTPSQISQGPEPNDSDGLPASLLRGNAKPCFPTDERFASFLRANALPDSYRWTPQFHLPIPIPRFSQTLSYEEFLDQPPYLRAAIRQGEIEWLEDRLAAQDPVSANQVDPGELAEQGAGVARLKGEGDNTESNAASSRKASTVGVNLSPAIESAGKAAEAAQHDDVGRKIRQTEPTEAERKASWILDLEKQLNDSHEATEVAHASYRATWEGLTEQELVDFLEKLQNDSREFERQALERTQMTEAAKQVLQSRKSPHAASASSQRPSTASDPAMTAQMIAPREATGAGASSRTASACPAQEPRQLPIHVAKNEQPSSGRRSPIATWAIPFL